MENESSPTPNDIEERLFKMMGPAYARILKGEEEGEEEDLELPSITEALIMLTVETLTADFFPVGAHQRLAFLLVVAHDQSDLIDELAGRVAVLEAALKELRPPDAKDLQPIPDVAPEEEEEDDSH